MSASPPVVRHSPAFEIEIVPDRERVVVVPVGEVDVATADRVEQEVEALVCLGFAAVVLDLRRVTFFDSSGLHLLERLKAAAVRDGVVFGVRTGGAGPARRLLELTGLYERYAVAAR
jgi:anti-anti-sigma factor